MPTAPTHPIAVPPPINTNAPSPPRSPSQSPPTAPKSVAFDFSDPEISRDHHRQSRRGSDPRGYETDDSDSTLDDRRRASQPITSHYRHNSDRDRHRDHRDHHRDHHRDQDRDHDRDRDHDQDRESHRHRRHSTPNASSSRSAPEPIASPTPSNETIDLPDRFDKDGRRKPVKGEDPLADAFDDLVSGKGPAAKALKGLFGGGR